LYSNDIGRLERAFIGKLRQLAFEHLFYVSNTWVRLVTSCDIYPDPEFDSSGQVTEDKSAKRV